jgi:hypothetical protein
MLNLGDVTRDAFFAYLTERHPELIERYRVMYRGRYAGAVETRAVKTAFAEAHAGITLTPPPTIEPEHAPEELSLFG